MKLFFHWFVSTLSILIAAYLIPGALVTLPGALIAAVVLAILNLCIKPVLLVLTLPINVLTLGLFTLVINAILVLIASAIVPGFVVGGFWNAVLFGIVLALVSWLFHFWSKV